MLVEILRCSLHFLPFCFIFFIAPVRASLECSRGGYWGIFVTPNSLFVGYIVWLDVSHTSEYCSLRTLITSPERDKPNGSYFVPNCVRTIFIYEFRSSRRRTSRAANERGF